jgi:hypothetical protein
LKRPLSYPLILRNRAIWRRAAKLPLTCHAFFAFLPVFTAGLFLRRIETRERVRVGTEYVLVLRLRLRVVLNSFGARNNRAAAPMANILLSFSQLIIFSIYQRFFESKKSAATPASA